MHNNDTKIGLNNKQILNIKNKDNKEEYDDEDNNFFPNIKNNTNESILVANFYIEKIKKNYLIMIYFYKVKLILLQQFFVLPLT